VEVREDHLWNPEIVFGVLDDVHAVSVVLERDHAVLGYLGVYIGNVLLGGVGVLDHTYNVVSAVHDSLVEQFV
jgi:hypothetical protein